MNKVRCLIVDDEELAVDIIAEYISRIDKLEIAGTCSNAIEALQFINEHPIDLLFLDIQMPGLTGLELTKSMSTRPEIIFTTAYTQYALEGFELEALDYLVKPISFERFIKAVNRYFKLHQQQELPSQADSTDFRHSFIFIKSDKMMIKVMLHEINYIESVRNYVSIFLIDGREVRTLNTISNIEEKLPASHFMRIHRSFIVSLDKIDSYIGGSVKLARQTIPIGRHYKEAFRQLMADRSID
ncbi:response regulator transcription factor [Carboxylicivirga sediminis]|uniref:Response regulator transcription factor n=1 Tax=Carboxylicivirga sediminis TaxID=2006564 RepID=A0A941IYG8_9BACT|nr:LytTR family DNA-binding domain-containing protein [Carboxylicivirga sediminis]MBR8536563.1 response regulator transcription factor [Carboxylicivirga sediminis]